MSLLLFDDQILEKKRNIIRLVPLVNMCVPLVFGISKNQFKHLTRQGALGFDDEIL